MAGERSTVVWDRNLGAIETMSPWAIPDGYTASASNVDLSASSVLRPRPGFTAFTTSSGPSGAVYNLFTDRTSGSEVLWAFANNGGTLTAYKYSGGWSSVSLTDTPATNTSPAPQVVATAYNGKVFLAYNSASNRLHVWDGSAVRRVGVNQPAAPAVADTGAGAYAAVIRYYKVQMGILSGTTIIASSELSAETSFTPSGGGTAARITKPTTIDSATHWRVFASADNITFYELDDWIAVGTTTKDDSYTVNLYSTNPDVAPEAGLFVPPPSAKFLATNGERLFMAGAYESSASAGETTPAPRRIWFTRPLGVTDRGDDEAITQTGDSRYYLDLDNDDGSPITGLISTIDGSVYVGTATSLWRLYDTGLTDEPVRAERVAAGIGPTQHTLMTVSDSASGGGYVYFGATDGPYRYSPSEGVQYLGDDWVLRSATSNSVNRFAMFACQWDPLTRRVIWIYSDEGGVDFEGKMRVFDPSLASVVSGIWRGGWSLDQLVGSGTTTIYCATVYNGRAMLAGLYGVAPAAFLVYRDPATNKDFGANYYTSSATSRAWIPDPTRNVRTERPYVFKKRAEEVRLVMRRNLGGSSENPSLSETLAASSPASSAVHERVSADSCVLADAYCFDAQIYTNYSAAGASVSSTEPWNDGVIRLVIPVVGQERG